MMPAKFNGLDKSTLAKRMDKIPSDLYVTCPYCKQSVYHQKLGPFQECPHCGYGFRLGAAARLKIVTDKFEAFDAELAVDPALVDDQYAEKLTKAKQHSGLPESVVTGMATIDSLQVAIGVMDSNFMMGSLGSATGEKLTRLFEEATRRRLPVVLYTASGGARMQEGLHSLMQMAKVTQAVTAHGEAGLCYLVVLTDPTTGGVTASFAMEADITLAEPHALIGFTGRRVIESTLHIKPPADFQQAETLLANGFVDDIVARSAQKATIVSLLKLSQGGA